MVEDKRISRINSSAGPFSKIAVPPWLILMVGVAIVTSLAAVSFDSSLRGKGDDAHYVVLAQAIANGMGLRQINSPRMPMETTFPFGFPLLLAPIIRVFGVNIAALKLVPLVCSIAAVVATYWLYALCLNRAWASLLALIVASCPLVISFSTQLRSEVPFLFLSTLSLALGISWAREENLLTPRFFFLALVLSLALLTRTVGIILILAVILCCWLEQHKKKALVLAAVVALTTAPFFVLSQSSPAQDTSYVFRALHIEPNLEESRTLSGSEVALRLGSYAWKYAQDLPEVFLLPFAAAAHRLGMSALTYALALAVVGLIGVGMKAELGSRRRLLAIYAPLYILVLLPQPACEPRYLLPVVPLLPWFAIRGTEVLAAGAHSVFPRIKPAGAQVALAVLLVIGGLLGGVHAAVTKPDKLMNLPEVVDYKMAGMWIAANTPGDAIILCLKPFYMYLWAGRRTEGFPASARSAALESWVRQTKATHLVVDNFGWQDKRTAFFRRLAKRDPQSYRLLYSAQTNSAAPTLVCRIVSPPSAASSSGYVRGSDYCCHHPSCMGERPLAASYPGPRQTTEVR